MVEPLKSRTLTLAQLQLETLDFIRKVRFQFGRQAHEEGMSDSEFLEKVADTLEAKILADRHVLKMHRANKAAVSPGSRPGS